MTRMSKLLILAALALFILACNLVTAPISEVGDVASTAQAFASEMPFETLQALATSVPVQTFEALPSAVPEVGKYLEPSGAPVDQWNNIPVMPEATSGEEFNSNTYSYTAPASASVVQQFYNQKMVELGWTSTVGILVPGGGGFLHYQKESEFVIITITPDQSDQNSVDVILQKE